MAKSSAFGLIILTMVFISVSCNSENSHKSVSGFSLQIADTIVPDEKYTEVIAPLKSALDSQMNTVIGYAAHDLILEPEKRETTLGTFITRIQYEKAREYYGNKVDAALMNSRGGIRAPLLEGPVTLGEIYALMPFENTLVMLELGSADVQRIFDKAAASDRFTIYPAQYDIHDSKAVNIMINDEPLQSNKKYIFVMSDYLANGGGGFDFLPGILPLGAEGKALRDIIIEYIKDLNDAGLKAGDKINE